MKMRNRHLTSLRSLPKSIQLGQVKLSALKRLALMGVYRRLFLQVGVMCTVKAGHPLPRRRNPANHLGGFAPASP